MLLKPNRVERRGRKRFDRLIMGDEEDDEAHEGQALQQCHQPQQPRIEAIHHQPGNPKDSPNHT